MYMLIMCETFGHEPYGPVDTVQMFSKKGFTVVSICENFNFLAHDITCYRITSLTTYSTPSLT